VREEALEYFWFNTFVVYPILTLQPHQMREGHSLPTSMFQCNAAKAIFRACGATGDYCQQLESDTYVDEIQFREQTLWLLSKAHNNVVMAPWKYQPSLVKYFKAKQPTNIRSLSFHPHGAVADSSDKEALQRQILNPLRLGTLVRIDMSGIFLFKGCKPLRSTMKQRIGAQKAEKAWCLSWSRDLASVPNRMPVNHEN
jgi:hypothetical protein